MLILYLSAGMKALDGNAGLHILGNYSALHNRQMRHHD
jgi:hypothetical protein